MKSIINGRRYNTDNAIQIAEARSHCGVSDYRWWHERLYRTPRSGAYFLHGEGHALSRYATDYGPGNGWGPGQRIVPMTRREAFEWCEQNQLLDVIEAQFGDLIEDA